MGLRQGFIHLKPVDTLIYSMFPGGYREARRTHYLLKSLGWITYGPPPTLHIAVYPNGLGEFRLENLDGEIIMAINYDPRKAVKIVKNVIIPGEHVDKYDDNTYFKYR